MDHLRRYLLPDVDALVTVKYCGCNWYGRLVSRVCNPRPIYIILGFGIEKFLIPES